MEKEVFLRGKKEKMEEGNILTISSFYIRGESKA